MSNILVAFRSISGGLNLLLHVGGGRAGKRHAADAVALAIGAEDTHGAQVPRSAGVLYPAEVREIEELANRIDAIDAPPLGQKDLFDET